MQFAEQIRQHFLTASYNGGRFPNKQELGYLRWGLQWLLPPESGHGDGGARDNNLNRQRQFLGGGGQDGLLFDTDGVLKEQTFQEAADFIRGQFGVGDPNFEDLSNHLSRSKSLNTKLNDKN